MRCILTTGSYPRGYRKKSNTIKKWREAKNALGVASPAIVFEYND